MLEHLTTGFFALTAFVGTLFHVVVVEFCTLLATATTRFGAGRADEVGERSAPRRDTSGGGTVVGAIQTRL